MIGAPGSRFQDGKCIHCDGNSMIALAIFIGVVGLLVFLAIKLNELRFVREVSIPLRTGAVYFQTIALLLGKHPKHCLVSANRIDSSLMICYSLRCKMARGSGEFIGRRSGRNQHGCHSISWMCCFI
jgi:hypothetical protein